MTSPESLSHLPKALITYFDHLPAQGESGGVGVAGRARVSQWPMISVDQAQKMVLDQVKIRDIFKSEANSAMLILLLLLMLNLQCSSMMREEMGLRVLATEIVNFRSALGRVLCQEVKSTKRYQKVQNVMK